MSDADENRLGDEQSPYLRQHAENPVNWQPWDEKALAAAKERDVPIFLSVGYSSCHWCHVMAEESFEDPEIAATMNDSYIPIKVDREERPDVDSIYQSICAMVTNHGGWPLSVWLTPEGKPFFVGTYFPKEGTQNRPGFGELLDRLATSWRESRSDIEERADQWVEAITDEVEHTPGNPGDRPGSDLLADAAGRMLRNADREHGGFGQGQKFPQTGRLHLLLRAADRTGRPAAGAVARETFDAMASGGLRDHVGGGFHRYCTDREWVVPHFEKMLYDNAELARAYLSIYQVTGEERYAEIARETFGFVSRELTSPGGGFYSTLDAQSEPPAGRNRTPNPDGEESDANGPGGREEGAFYVWTPAEIHNAIEDENSAELFCERYGVRAEGNFEGRSVLTQHASIADLAAEHDRSPEAIEAALERARGQVFEAREDRPRPPRDEKILAGWNGLMIAAFAEGALVLDPEYATPAVDALDFCRETLWNETENRLKRRYKDGEVKIDAYLEDYAFLARGALACYEATGEVRHLTFALDLAEAIEADFFDREAGTIYFTAASDAPLIARPQELNDQSTPSSVGVACETVLALDQFVEHDRFADIATTVVATHADTLRADPRMRSSLVLAADRAETGWLECTVVADTLPAAWRERIGGAYLPDRLLSVRPPQGPDLDRWLSALGTENPPAIWAGREQRNGDPTIYVCRDFTCSPPQTDIDDAFEWIEAFGSGTGSDEQNDASGDGLPGLSEGVWDPTEQI